MQTRVAAVGLVAAVLAASPRLGLAQGAAFCLKTTSGAANCSYQTMILCEQAKQPNSRDQCIPQWTERRGARRRRSATRDRSAPRLRPRIQLSPGNELHTAALPRSLVRAAARPHGLHMGVVPADAPFSSS